MHWGFGLWQMNWEDTPQSISRPMDLLIFSLFPNHALIEGTGIVPLGELLGPHFESHLASELLFIQGQQFPWDWVFIPWSCVGWRCLYLRSQTTGKPLVLINVQYYLCYACPYSFSLLGLIPLVSHGQGFQSSSHHPISFLPRHRPSRNTHIGGLGFLGILSSPLI